VVVFDAFIVGVVKLEGQHLLRLDYSGRTPPGQRFSLQATATRQDWIAERLHLKSASNVSQRVRQYRLLNPAEKSRAMRTWERRFAK
jgi:hypothetical protein